MIKDFKSQDLIALVLILGYFVLTFKGTETMMTQAILLLVGYYFGRRGETITTITPPKNGQSKDLEIKAKE